MNLKPLLLIPCLLLMGCTTAQFESGLTQSESAAWTAANALETVNTATGGSLTTALVNLALVQTHNTGDTQIVQAAAAEANKVIAAQAAAKVAGASPAGIQAAATNILSDPGVIQTVAANLPAPSSFYDGIDHLKMWNDDPKRFVVSAELRCPWREYKSGPYHVKLAGNP